MSEEEEYRHVYEFIANHSYPTGFSKNQKRVLRRKCQERFCIRSGLLYYMRARIKSGDKLPDLLRIERELCSPVIHQLKVSNLRIIRDNPISVCHYSIRMQV